MRYIKWLLSSFKEVFTKFEPSKEIGELEEELKITKELIALRK